MITKGAVVIIKHGDPEFADSMEKGLVKKIAGPSSDQAKYISELERENFFLRRIVERETGRNLAELESEYGYNRRVPRIFRRLSNGWALIMYGITRFVDKYLVIRE